MPNSLNVSFYFYDGKLSNSGELLKTQNPETFDGDNEIFYVDLDQVSYQDDWYPNTDGDGNSLTRLSATDFGRDKASWASRAPSPGTASLAISPAPNNTACGN